MKANALLLVGLLVVVGRSNGCHIIPYNTRTVTSSEQADDPRLQENTGTSRGNDEDGNYELSLGDVRGDVYDEENYSLRDLIDNYDGTKLLARGNYRSGKFNQPLHIPLEEENAAIRENLRRKQWELNRAKEINRRMSSLELPMRSDGPGVYYNQRTNDLDRNIMETMTSETKRGTSKVMPSDTRNLMVSSDALRHPQMRSKVIKNVLDDIIQSSDAEVSDKRLHLDLIVNNAQETPLTARESDDINEMVSDPRSSLVYEKALRMPSKNMIRHLTGPQNSLTMSTFPEVRRYLLRTGEMED